MIDSEGNFGTLLPTRSRKTRSIVLIMYSCHVRAKQVIEFFLLFSPVLIIENIEEYILRLSVSTSNININLRGLFVTQLSVFKYCIRLVLQYTYTIYTLADMTDY